MKATPCISIVMPTYNRAEYIEEALDSIAQQSIAALEVIVVDDGSTDDTADRVRRHSLGSRIAYLRQKGNLGASVARNLGVDMARGEVIVFLDSDDLLEPEHHRIALEVLRQDTGVGLFCCDSHMIGASGEWLHERRSWTQIQCDIKRVQIQTGHRSLADVFLFSTPFPGFTIRRDVYLSVGGLDQSIFPLDDYDLQLKVAAAGHHVYYEHRALARYRVHGNNESGQGRAVRVGEQKMRCVTRALERYPVLRNSGLRIRRRLGEVQREMGLAMVRDGQPLGGSGRLLQSIVRDPRGVEDLLRIACRKLRRAMPQKDV